MSEDDRVEQKIDISGSGSTGDIKLIGKIVINPAQWQDDAWAFFARHRYFIFSWAALQALLAWGWFEFHNLYQIPPTLWVLSGILLSAAAWGAYIQIWQKRTRVGLAATLLFTGALVGLLSLQVYAILFPPAFGPHVYGIVLAQLGESGDYRSSRSALEISDQTYQHICNTLRATVEKNRCWQTDQNAADGGVQIQRVGIISNPQMALDYGRKVHAKIVIWGNLLIASQGKASVRFQLLESPDREVTPNFSLILPITMASADLFTNELDLNSDPIKFKDEVAQEADLITSVALGMAAFSRMDYPGADNKFNNAVQLANTSAALQVNSPGKSLLSFYTGRGKLYMGRIQEGIDHLLAAQKENPSEPAIPLSLAFAYNTLGNEAKEAESLKAAASLIQNWLANHPDDAQAVYDRGIMRMLMKEYEQAVLDFQSTIEINPDFYIAYISLAQAYMETGRFDEAVQALNQAFALAGKAGTNPLWTHINLARVQVKAGKTAEGKREFQLAMAAAPENQWPYFYSGEFFDKQNEVDAAEEAYKKLTSLAWNKSWAYGILADFYRRHNLQEQALDSYTRAVNANPNDSLLRTYRAEVLYDAGRIQEALKEHRSAVDLNEPIPYVYASSGVAFFNQGSFADAAQRFEKAISLDPLYGEAHFSLGRTYDALQQLDKAKAAYLHCLEFSSALSPEQVQYVKDRLAVLGGNNP